MLREDIRGQTHWNHNHRKLVNLITWTTALSNSMKLSHARGATQDGRVMVERSDRMWSMEKGMANHFSILAFRTPWTVWKGKKDTKMNSPARKVPSMLLEISGEITPERMKGWSQSENKTQLWMGLVIKARSDAVKSNIAQESGMLGPWIKANWKWSNRRWQELTSTF